METTKMIKDKDISLEKQNKTSISRYGIMD